MSGIIAFPTGVRVLNRPELLEQNKKIPSDFPFALICERERVREKEEVGKKNSYKKILRLIGEELHPNITNKHDVHQLAHPFSRSNKRCT